MITRRRRLAKGLVVFGVMVFYGAQLQGWLFPHFFDDLCNWFLGRWSQQPVVLTPTKVFAPYLISTVFIPVTLIFGGLAVLVYEQWSKRMKEKKETANGHG